MNSGNTSKNNVFKDKNNFTTEILYELFKDFIKNNSEVVIRQFLFNLMIDNYLLDYTYQTYESVLLTIEYVDNNERRCRHLLF